MKNYVPTTLDNYILESKKNISTDELDEGMFDKEHLKKAGNAMRKGAGWFAPSLLSVQQAIKAGMDVVKNSSLWQDRLAQVEQKLPKQKEKFLEFLGRNPEVKYFKWDGTNFVDTAHVTSGGGGILVGTNKNQPKYEGVKRKGRKLNEDDEYDLGGHDDKVYSFTSDTCVDVKQEGDKWVIDRDGEEEADAFDDALKENGVEYEIINPHGPGGGWPEITYAGTKKQLAPIMALLNASGYTEEEILHKLRDWDGDEEYLFDILG